MVLQRACAGQQKKMPMLEVDAITAGYGETQILRGVSLRVDAGEIVAVLGANGVGKTTLNHAISGLIKVRSGTIHFSGEKISGQSAGRYCGGWVDSCARRPQDFSQYDGA